VASTNAGQPGRGRSGVRLSGLGATPAVAVRPRRDDDIGPLADILVRVHERDGYPVEGVDDPIAWLRAPNELGSWTAEWDGVPVGHVMLLRAMASDDVVRSWRGRTGRDISRLAILARLFVDPAARRLGAGRRLVTDALSHASGLGCSVALDVMMKDQAAIRLYESLGAQHLGGVCHHYGEGQAEPAAVYAWLDGVPGNRAQARRP